MRRNEEMAELGCDMEGLLAILARRAALRPSPRQVLCNQDMCVCGRAPLSESSRDAWGFHGPTSRMVAWSRHLPWTAWIYGLTDPIPACEGQTTFSPG